MKHGWHFLLLNLFTFQNLLLLKILLPWMMSLRFFFTLSAKTGGSAKGRVLLYVTVSAKRLVLDI